MAARRSNLNDIHQKAIGYVHGKTECVWFYRNQSEAYFNGILQSDGIMKTQMKDNGGDPSSPINGRLQGLFFMAKNSYGGSLPSFSYFGPRRIQILADELVNKAGNIYFADFYCMRGKRHYVILVMTKHRSAADTFCRRNLIKLSLYDRDENPFLFMEGDRLYTPSTENLDIEIFYTENLNIRKLEASGKAQFSTVEGRGTARPGGTPKDLSCGICNTNPLPGLPNYARRRNHSWFPEFDDFELWL